MQDLARSNQTQAWEARLKRLAGSIDALAERDRQLMNHAKEMAALRRKAAAALHGVCAEFVTSVNRLLSQTEMLLDPVDFPQEAFRPEGSNLVQISVRGRILQVEFSSTDELVSTEDFRIPYTLEGSVRAFNQALLEKDRIEEQLIFYTLEDKNGLWRFFDARTYRSGVFDQEYLAGLMEQLL